MHIYKKINVFVWILQILGSLEVYIVVNFRTRKINQSASKLVQKPTLIFLKKCLIKFTTYIEVYQWIILLSVKSWLSIWNLKEERLIRADYRTIICHTIPLMECIFNLANLFLIKHKINLDIIVLNLIWDFCVF